jgi:hypothetical protein
MNTNVKNTTQHKHQNPSSQKNKVNSKRNYNTTKEKKQDQHT